MKKATFPVKYYAHRGLHDAKRPENSTAAFWAAREKGFGAELDILLDADGNVVVFHDSNLKRMTGCNGYVWDTPRSRMEILRLAGTDEKIPYLAELLTLVSPMPLLVELKTCPQWKLRCEKRLPRLRRYGGHVAIESFDPRIVRWFKQHAPDITRGLLIVRYNEKNMPNPFKRMVMNSGAPIWYTKPHYLSIPEDCVNLPYVKKALDSGLALCTWTIRSKDHIDADVVTFEGWLPGEDEKEKDKENADEAKTE